MRSMISKLIWLTTSTVIAVFFRETCCTCKYCRGYISFKKLLHVKSVTIHRQFGTYFWRTKFKLDLLRYDWIFFYTCWSKFFHVNWSKEVINSILRIESFVIGSSSRNNFVLPYFFYSNSIVPLHLYQTIFLFKVHRGLWNLNLIQILIDTNNGSFLWHPDWFLIYK